MGLQDYLSTGLLLIFIWASKTVLESDEHRMFRESLIAIRVSKIIVRGPSQMPSRKGAVYTSLNVSFEQ